MKLLILIFLVSTSICYSQSREEFLLLGELYHKNEYDKKLVKKISRINSDKVSECTTYVLECVQNNNKTLTKDFLKKPSIETLKSVYIVVHLNYNLHRDNPKDSEVVLDELLSSEISYGVLLKTYYYSLFGNLVNKMDSLDFRTINFDYKDLDLKTELEKGVFFLVVMERLGGYYWGNETIKERDDINILIQRYPRFDGKQYFEYNKFDFEDFKLIIDYRRPEESFKDYYLSKFIGLLQFHFKWLKDGEIK